MTPYIYIIKYQKSSLSLMKSQLSNKVPDIESGSDNHSHPGLQPKAENMDVEALEKRSNHLEIFFFIY